MRAARGIQAVNTVWALAEKTQVVFFPASFSEETWAYYDLPRKGPILKEVSRKIGPFKSLLRYLLALLPHLKGGDLVYTRHLKAAWWLVKLKALHRKPVVYEAHEIFTEKHPHLEKVEAQVFKSVQGVVCVSQGLKRAIGTRFSTKATVIPNGTRLLKINLEAKFASSPRFVLYVGSLRYPWKGGESLLSSLTYWPQGLKLLLVGGKKDHPRIKSLGFVPPAKIPPFLKRAQLAVLPNSSKMTQSQLYTSPLKLLDYMAAGCAVVASDLPSVRELVSEKEALLVPPDDPKALAEGISHLLNDTKLRLSLAKAAYNRAKEFTWQRRAARILSFLKEL